MSTNTKETERKAKRSANKETQMENKLPSRMRPNHGP